MLALVGNAPSSGSTLLADLLDSTVHSAAGPELRLFSNRRLYDFQSFKENILVSGPSQATYRGRFGFTRRYLPPYGLGIDTLEEMIRDCEDLEDFLPIFARHYLVFRGKNPEGIVFEKTPPNIFCLGEFLRSTKDACFIHIVRDPLYVHASLLRRGFGPFCSAIAWLMAAAKHCKYAEHPRLILIRYEDLVEDPYGTARDLLLRLAGIDVSEREIEEGYRTNEYRRMHVIRAETWGQRDVGKIVSANKKPLRSEDVSALSGMLNAKISRRHAEMFDLAEVCFVDALRRLGYYDSFMESLEGIARRQAIPGKSCRDLYWYFRKWVGSLVYSECGLGGLKAYMDPIEPVARG